MERSSFKNVLLPGVAKVFDTIYDDYTKDCANALASSMNQTLDEAAARVFQECFTKAEVEALNLNDEEATAMKKLLTKAARL